MVLPNNENNQVVTGITYTQTNWVDGVTPVDAEHLNNIEGGVASLVNAVSILQESVDNAVTGEMNDKQNKVDASLQTPENSVVGAINYLYNNKQNKIGDSISLSGNGNTVSIEISDDRLKIEDGDGGDVELFGISSPSYGTSAANRAYVDSAISGVNSEIGSVKQSKQDKDAGSISLSGNGGRVTASYESQNRINMSGDSDSAVSIGGVGVSNNPDDTDAANVGYANSVPENVQYTFSSGSKTVIDAINDLYASKQDNVSDNISLSDGTNRVTLACDSENTLSVSGTSGSDIKISGVADPADNNDVANKKYADLVPTRFDYGEDLDTSSKTVVGAINELNSTCSKELSITSKVLIDPETLKTVNREIAYFSGRYLMLYSKEDLKDDQDAQLSKALFGENCRKVHIRQLSSPSTVVTTLELQTGETIYPSIKFNQSLVNDTQYIIQRDFTV